MPVMQGTEEHQALRLMSISVMALASDLLLEQHQGTGRLPHSLATGST